VARILIVDDHALVRRSVCSLLACHSLEVCGEAEDGREGIQKLKDLQPDIVLLDIEMPRMGGIEAAPEMLRILPSVKIVFLTMHYHPLFAEKVAACSHGFLNKAEAGTQLVPTLKRLLAIESPRLNAPPAWPSGSSNCPMSYGWQQPVADAFAAPQCELPGKINAAEKAVAGRLMEVAAIDPAERIALKEALRALRQLISETKVSSADDLDEKKGAA
jgi:DNA-binding NarL/FixJ family response regulator